MNSCPDNQTRKERESKVREHEEKTITEEKFLLQMMAESERCTNAMLKAKAALVWNAANTLFILVAILLNAL